MAEQLPLEVVQAVLSLVEGQDATPVTDENRPRPLSPDEVKGILAREINSALMIISGGELETHRRVSKHYYEGRAYGAPYDIPGRSTAYTQDVFKNIEWIKPALMRIFTASESVVRYTHRDRLDTPPEYLEAQAEQATDYVTRQFEAQGGFQIIYEAVTDALLEKIGITKVTNRKKVSRCKKTFTGLTERDAVSLLSEPGTIPVAYEQRESMIPIMTPQGPMPMPIGLYDIQVVQMSVEPELHFECIAPEHFLYSSQQTRVDDRTPFLADRRRVTKSELVGMGYPPELVYPLSPSDEPTFDQAHTERYQDESPIPGHSSMRPDVASQEVWVTDCYLLVDEDGDGYAERRNILVAGTGADLTILEDKEVNGQPYAVWNAIPLSHKVAGMAVSDLIVDQQLLRSMLLRYLMEFIYQQVSPPTEVVEGEVNIEDMLNRRAGSIVRVRAPGMILPHPPQNLPPAAFELFGILEKEIESRTGVSKATQGMDLSAAKNQTMGGIFELLNSQAVRLDMYARCLAETGLKQTFRQALRCVIEAPPVAAMVRLRGTYVPVDPTTWDPEMEVEADVAIGAGQTAQRTEALKGIGEWQLKFLEMGKSHMVPDTHLHAMVTRLVREAGWRNPEQFFANPQFVPPPPPPPPDPKMIKEMSMMQARVAETALDQAQLAVDAQEAQANAMAQLMQAQAAMIQALASMKVANKPTPKKE